MNDPSAYHGEAVLYLTPNSRFDHLLALPEGSNIGKAINEAMRDIEKHNSSRVYCRKATTFSRVRY
jgi:type I restriction enzyme M protein